MKQTIDLRQNIKPVQEPEPLGLEFSDEKDAEKGNPQVISWSGPLYYYNPDMKVVIAVSVIFLVLAVLFQFFQKNIITTVLMALIGIMIFFRAKVKQDNIGEIVINPIGVKLQNQTHKFKEIKSFWVDYDPELGMEELSLQLKKWYMPYIRIPIEGQDPVRLRAFLIQFIPEVQHETTIGDAIARRLGI